MVRFFVTSTRKILFVRLNIASNNAFIWNLDSKPVVFDSGQKMALRAFFTSGPVKRLLQEALGIYLITVNVKTIDLEPFFLFQHHLMANYRSSFIDS